MRPTIRLLKITGAWFAAAVVLAALRAIELQPVDFLLRLWWGVGALLLITMLYDWLTRPGPSLLSVARRWPDSLAAGAQNHVQLWVRNDADIPVDAVVSDDPPPSMVTYGLPVRIRLMPDEVVRLDYVLEPTQRGDAHFGAPWIRVKSRLGWWESTGRVGPEGDVRVFPNFRAVSRFDQLGLARELGLIGARNIRRRGEGMDFQELRPFRSGDSLRQIDWHATARLRKLTARQYQDERDQEIIFLLDCGRRMRALDEGRAHFDHALDAVLVAAHVALRQGDGVGILGFSASTDPRWQPPVKGTTAINRLVRSTYDLDATLTSSDYLSAATYLLARQRRRALVILVSNLQDEMSDDLIEAVKLLRRRFHVVIASLREEILDRRLVQPIEEFDDALTYLGVLDHVADREKMLLNLRKRGFSVIDTPPRKLHMELVAEYMRIKRVGVF